MAKTIGCIGCGNMGSAILGGLADKLDKTKWKLCGYDKSEECLDKLAEKNIQAMHNIPELIKASDIIIFAVKPHHMPEAMREAAPGLNKDKTVVSIAAGVGLANLRNNLGPNCAIIRCMPTTTALVGRGVFAFCPDPVNPGAEIPEDIVEIFDLLGLCQVIPENSFTAYSALIGAGPAYIFEIMHALTQAGVTLGFTGTDSARMITELVGGCADLAAQEQKTFMQLRDAVCSPAGLTIAGINALDRAGFTGLIVEAVQRAEQRGREMEK